jgi:hypothetical protein
MASYTFMKKENRDAKARELKNQGINFKKRSWSNQQLHPQYVNDYPYELAKEDCGFGNTVYKTVFSKIYTIEVI